MERLLDEHIEKLKRRVMKMCSLVDEQVQSAIKSVEEENLDLAKEVIEKENFCFNPTCCNGFEVNNVLPYYQ
jgi:phosphate uptake regulator